MTDDDKIADMLLTWEEARELGNVVTAEELCQDHPALLDVVRERIRLLSKAGWLREPSPTAPLKPRTLAERYSLETLIGSGGYAQVWRAYDLQLHRHESSQDRAALPTLNKLATQPLPQELP